MVVEDLNQFRNIPLPKRAWTIILNGLGCPKNNYFWKAFKELLLIKIQNCYILNHIDDELYEMVHQQYLENNRKAVSKHYDRQKRIAKIQQYKQQTTRVIVVNGCIIPYSDRESVFEN